MKDFPKIIYFKFILAFDHLALLFYREELDTHLRHLINYYTMNLRKLLYSAQASQHHQKLSLNCVLYLEHYRWVNIGSHVLFYSVLIG